MALQAYVNYLSISLPAQAESTFEYIRAYVSFCVQKSNNWLAFSKALMYRTKNEVDRSKTMDRSLAQGQALIDQFREAQSATFMEKIDVVFACNYPMFWGVQHELAKLYNKLGVYMSAYELLHRVGIHEEAIRCLFKAGRHTQAVEAADELMRTSTT